MKFLLPCLTLACAFGALHAEELSDSDKAKAIQWLEEYKDKLSSGDSKRVNEAKSILKRAASDEGSALELLKSSVKKVQFDDNGKSSLDYITWEKNQKELFSSPAFKSGLRLQCRWALITLGLAEAKKKKKDITFPMAEVTSVYNDILSDSMVIRNKDLAAGGHIDVIRKFLRINDLTTDMIPGSPFEIGGLFEKTILPAIEKTGNIADYRKTWLWRIDLEKRINIDPDSYSEQDSEDSSNSNSSRRNKTDRDSGGHDKKKSGGIANDRKGKLISENGNELNSKSRLARETKVQNKLADLRWDMEVGCFKIGDEKTALTALKAMLMASTDPEQLNRRITMLNALLTSSSEITPPVRSTGDKDMSGNDEWDFSGSTKQVPAAASKDQSPTDTVTAPDKPAGPVSADSLPVAEDTKTPPAQPEQKQPDKAASEDDWSL